MAKIVCLKRAKICKEMMESEFPDISKHYVFNINRVSRNCVQLCIRSYAHERFITTYSSIQHIAEIQIQKVQNSQEYNEIKLSWLYSHLLIVS